MLPPYSPKMNTRVEYVHGTCRREFYECTELAADLEAARRQWAEWEDTYNRVRPHESLDPKTPIEYITPQSLSRACSQMFLYEGHPLCKPPLDGVETARLQIYLRPVDAGPDRSPRLLALMESADPRLI